MSFGQRWLQAVHSWFSTSRAACLTCEREAAGGGSRELTGVCGACLARVTWIRELRCLCCGRAEACPDCARSGANRALIANRAAVTYSECMKEWLGLYKYRGHERLGALFGEMLEVPYRRYVEELGGGRRGPFDCLTFVPVSERRLRERGFNQAEQMARALGNRHRIPVIPLLRRSKHTDKQSFKTRSERQRDMRGIFEVHEEGIRIGSAAHPSLLQSRRIAIIDDVYTTGSTMAECARVLSGQLDAQIYGISWAR